MSSKQEAGSVKVVVIGANGLVGARLAKHLTTLTDIHVDSKATLPIGKILLMDVNELSAVDAAVLEDPRVQAVKGELTDKATMERVLDAGAFSAVTTIHLAALLSGYAEDNFDLGMKINLFGTINVMECVRELSAKMGTPQKYVYVSTDYVACFNEYNRTHAVTEESFRLSPVSYGVQKACNELLLCDYSRKGFIDGRVARLSAVLGRPGWSNSISYPYTGIFTQTLEGKDYEVSLPMDVPYPCSSLNTDVSCLVDMAGRVEADKLGHNRVVQLPAVSLTLATILEATKEVAAEEGINMGTVTVTESGSGDTTVKEINVCPVVDCSKAASLGLPTTVDIKEIIRDYVNHYIKK